MSVGDEANIKVVQEINLPDSVIAMNIFYYRADFTEAQEDEDVVTACRQQMSDIYTEIVAEMADTVELGDVTVYKYNVITDQWDNVGSDTTEVAGTNATDMLPHGVGALVRAYSTNPRSIARKYIPGFAEDRQADGIWTETALAAMVLFGNEWATVKVLTSGNDLNPGVFDNKLKEVHRLTGVEVALATPAYQRRRRPGVGI